MFSGLRSVDDAVAVQVAECARDLGRIEAGSRLREVVLLLQVEVQLAAVHVLEYEVELVARLERVVQIDQERVIQALQQHVTFAHDVVLLFSLDDHLLLQHLDRIDAQLLAIARQQHLAVAALTDHLEELEIGRLDVQLFGVAEIDLLAEVVVGQLVRVGLRFHRRVAAGRLRGGGAGGDLVECAAANGQRAVVMMLADRIESTGVVRVGAARAVRRVDRAAGRAGWNSNLRLALFQSELIVGVVEHGLRRDDLGVLVDSAARLLLAI